MSVYKRSGSETYAFDFWRGGQRFSGTTGETDRRRAQAIEHKLIAEAEEVLRQARRMGRLPMTLDAAAARYWDEVGQLTASAAKLDSELERLVRLIGPETPLAAINDAVIAGAVAARRSDFVKSDPKRGRISPAQVNRSTTQLLRRILTRAKVIWKVALPEEPNWKAHVLAEPRERVRELRLDEEAKLDEAERDDYRAPRLFAQLTGLRRREVAGLTWRQVDFGAETISVVGKGNKPHVLPLTGELRAIIEPLRRHHPTAVFTYQAVRTNTCGRTGKKRFAGKRYPITYEGLATHFKRSLGRAGIADFRLHDLRHTAATRALRATGNLRFVQRLLAHSSPATTAKYAHLNLSDMRELMAVTAADDARRKAGLLVPQQAGNALAKQEGAY